MDNEDLRAQLERHHVDAFGWALHLCRSNPQDAANLLQTAYVNILSRQSMFSQRASFKTWLFTVIRKTAADLRRREWLRRVLPITDAEADTEHQLDRQPRPDQWVDASEQTASLRQALARLPARQGEVLDLVFYHDLSIAEAATVMRVSIGSARRHYERAKQRMRRYLTEDGAG
jgi:RNA polymerase sigma-70 factor (ECF subfamily)